MDYNFKFTYKGERGFWNTTIKANNNEEAIKKAETFLSRRERVGKARLEKIVYKYKKIKEWDVDTTKED